MAKAAGISFEAQGIEEVKNALAGVRNSVATRILKSAMTFAIKPLQKTVSSAAPTLYGTLKRSIINRVKQYAKSAVTVGLTGPKTTYKEIVAGTPAPFMGPKFAKPHANKPSKYAHLVEKGTKTHFIPAPGYGRKSRKKAGQFYSEGPSPGWMHPGAKAFPFISWAAKTQSATVIQRFRDQALKRVDIEFKRALSKGRKFWETDV